MTPAERRDRRAIKRRLLRQFKQAVRTFELRSGGPTMRRLALACVEIHRERARLHGSTLPATPWEKAAQEGGA